MSQGSLLDWLVESSVVGEMVGEYYLVPRLVD